MSASQTILCGAGLHKWRSVQDTYFGVVVRGRTVNPLKNALVDEEVRRIGAKGKHQKCACCGARRLVIETEEIEDMYEPTSLRTLKKQRTPWVSTRG
jgi:hypothetical protein